MNGAHDAGLSVFQGEYAREGTREGAADARDVRGWSGVRADHVEGGSDQRNWPDTAS